jgi:soluble lytic murein transglycosylase-like protein
VIRKLSGTRYLAAVIGIWITLAAAWAQTNPEKTNPETGQAERAFSAMEQSLARQKASLETFQGNIQAGSFQQRESNRKQYLATHGNEPGDDSLAIPPITRAPAQETVHQKSTPGFFTAPWPSSLPLAVPNVQVVDESCDALNTDDVEKLATQAALKHGLDKTLLKSIMRQESGYKPCALSVAGAMGLMQIMPETAEMLGLDDPFDEVKNVDAGAKFLKMMLDRYQGDVRLALAAYNAGPGRVDKAGEVPSIPETLDYIDKVLGGMPIAY